MSASKHRIYFLLQRVAHRLKTEADAALAEACGLTTAQVAALSIIATEGPVTQRQVARSLSQRESAITTMATRLQKAGYVTRRRSSTDARAWELRATDSGRRALAKVRRPFGRINAVLDACFGPEEIEELAGRLEDVLAGLERKEGRRA